MNKKGWVIFRIEDIVNTTFWRGNGMCLLHYFGLERMRPSLSNTITIKLLLNLRINKKCGVILRLFEAEISMRYFCNLWINLYFKALLDKGFRQIFDYEKRLMICFLGKSAQTLTYFWFWIRQRIFWRFT